ncbi:Integrin alpha-IIb, partial [Varanus komodoensis]
MAGGLVSFWPPAALRLFLVVSLLFSSPAKTLNLQASNPTVYSEANGSYFGFALDFYRDKNGRMNVVVGAPRANTSQPLVTEAGSVYLCPWVASGSKCTPLLFDTLGDQTEKLGPITMKTFKSKQWLGASVNTWKDTIMTCAPFQHWNYISGTKEATKTPVGSCFLATEGLQHFSEYSPCRDNKIHSVYISTLFVNDRRYCEIGFSLAISDTGRVLLGAPGGYYFG